MEFATRPVIGAARALSNDVHSGRTSNELHFVILSDTAPSVITCFQDTECVYSFIWIHVMLHSHTSISPFSTAHPKRAITHAAREN